MKDIDVRLLSVLLFGLPLLVVLGSSVAGFIKLVGYLIAADLNIFGYIFGIAALFGLCVWVWWVFVWGRLVMLQALAPGQT